MLRQVNDQMMRQDRTSGAYSATIAALSSIRSHILTTKKGKPLSFFRKLPLQAWKAPRGALESTGPNEAY